jgi:hypothetical protein
MLKPIEAGPYSLYLPRELEEAETGNATIFNVRRVNGLEATELDLIVERAEERARGMDEQGGAAVIFAAWRRCFVQIVDSIENGADDGVALDKFADQYLVLTDIKYLVNCSKFGLALAEIDAAIKEQRLKNASGSSPGSTHGKATATGENSSSTATTAPDTDGKTREGEDAS